MTDTDMASRHEGFQGILSFELPQPWGAQKLRPEVELFGSMPPTAGEFTPNVVVTVNPFSGTLQDFCQRAVSGIVASLKEGRIIDVDSWGYWTEKSENGGEPAAAYRPEQVGHDGRLIEYTHRAPIGRTVSGVDYLVLLDGWAVQISTTTALQTRHLFEETFETIARSVTPLHPADGQDLNSAQNEKPGAAIHAGRDAVASRVLGEDVEDYSFYQSSGSWIGEGTWMSGAAIARMAELEDSVVGRLSAAGGDPVLDELRALGVLEGGRLSEIADVMATALNNAPARVRLNGRFLDESTTLEAFALGDLALVVAAQGYGPRVLNQPWHPDDPTMFNVQLIPLSELSSCASRWAGAGPAWNLHVAPHLLETGVMDERFAGEAPVPSGANDVMEQVWNQPWFVWQIEAEGEAGAIDPIAYVNAGIRGNYRVGILEDPETHTDKSAMFATDSSFILRQLEDVIQAVVFGREVQWT